MMNKNLKISYVISGSMFFLILLFLFFPSQTIASEKGADYKVESPINKVHGWISKEHVKTISMKNPKMNHPAREPNQTSAPSEPKKG